jgi:hypothetical protein
VEVSIVELAVDLLDRDKCAKSKLRDMVWKCNAKRMTAREGSRNVIRQRPHIPSQEQVSDTCTREVETRRRPATLDNLKSDNIEHRPN